jgi:hypothetical protein
VAAPEGVVPLCWQNKFATPTPTRKMRSERDISGELEPEAVSCCGSLSARLSLTNPRSPVRNSSTETSCFLFKSTRSDGARWARLHTNMKCWRAWVEDSHWEGVCVPRALPKLAVSRCSGNLGGCHLSGCGCGWGGWRRLASIIHIHVDYAEL